MADISITQQFITQKFILPKLISRSIARLGLFLRSLCVIALAVWLTACSAVGNGPTQALIEQAIALQLNQTQQGLSQQLKLKLDANSFGIKSLAVTQQTPLMIDQLQSFRVQGTYDLVTKLPNREVTQRHNPFEVYLQRQAEGKTWRAARLETDVAGVPQWLTQRLPY